MKLDPTILRTLSRSSLRVLSAVETGMTQGHYLVPSALVASIANLRHGGSRKFLNDLLRDKLVSHDQSCGYDGYRLTNSGYDILALDNLKRRGVVVALGDQIGIGKESDVYIGVMPNGRQVVLKFHRLGRTSFRDVKKKRDYFAMDQFSKHSKRSGNATSKPPPNSWLFLSRLSAVKEYAFMKALHNVSYPTPTPVAHNRHVVVMGLVRGVPLYQVHSRRISSSQAASIFHDATTLGSRLARHGLVHCDLNEFNLMVDMSGGVQNALARDDDAGGDHYVRHSGMSVRTKGALSAHGPLTADGERWRDGTGEVATEEMPRPVEILEDGEPRPVVTLIDFPQMVSTRHPNAKELYERDMECLRRFFACKLKCQPEGGWEEVLPKWEDVYKGERDGDGEVDEGDEDDVDCLASKAQLRLDEELKASGFSDQDAQRDMELYYLKQSHDTLPTPKEISSDNDEQEEDDDDESDNNASPSNDAVTPSIHTPQNDESHDVERQRLISDNDEFPAADDDDSDGSDDSIEKKWKKAERKAQTKVRRHLDDVKKVKSRKGAFRTKNSNKSYAKGKRIMSDMGY